LVDIELLLLDEFQPEASCEALFALAEREVEPPFWEAESLAEDFWLASFAARLAFAAELSEALAFKDLLEALALLFELLLLEPVAKLSLAAKEALPANVPCEAELLLAALLEEAPAEALWDLPLFFVEPEPCQ
jgi:hypothetical protein